MESTRLYGYDPTLWIAILFTVYCLIGLCTIFPTLFIKYRSITLGTLVTVGLLFQITGHVSVAVSSSLHNNFPTWAMQRFAFALGKLTARTLVFYTYYTCFSRIMVKRKHKFMLFPLMGLTGVGFIIRFVGLGFEISSLVGNVKVDKNIMTVLPAALLFSASALLTITLIYVILLSRREVPWHRLTWMTGYYVTLQLVPLFIMIQDIYDLVKGLVLVRNEMLELTFDMSLTKSTLMMLSGQSYEVASAWSQKHPKVLEKIVLQLSKIFSRRRQQPNEQKNEVKDY